MLPLKQYLEPLPERRPYDHYPTPEWVCWEALARVDWEPERIVDPGAGAGVWGRVAREKWPLAWIVGVEVRDVPRDPAYSEWISHPYPIMLSPCDLVIGNPPYNQAEQWIRHSLEMLETGGQIIFLLRLAFLEGKRRKEGLFRDYPPKRVDVCSRRPSFNENGKGTNATSFAVFTWEQGWRGETALGWIG